MFNFKSCVNRITVKENLIEKELYAIKEEEYEIIIANYKYSKVTMIPNDLEYFLYGHLYSNGVIKSKEQIVNYRVCDANRFHVYLDTELVNSFNSAGSVYNYLALQPYELYSDIVPVRSDIKFKKNIINKIYTDIMIDDYYFAATVDSDGAYGNAFIDTNADTLLDKISGIHGWTDNRKLALVTNIPAGINLAKRLCFLRIPVLFTFMVPTTGALAILKKADITAVQNNLIFSDRVNRITD